MHELEQNDIKEPGPGIGKQPGNVDSCKEFTVKVVACLYMISVSSFRDTRTQVLPLLLLVSYLGHLHPPGHQKTQVEAEEAVLLH
jgi:hypothetical protein